MSVEIPSSPANVMISSRSEAHVSDLRHRFTASDPSFRCVEKRITEPGLLSVDPSYAVHGDIQASRNLRVTSHNGAIALRRSGAGMVGAACLALSRAQRAQETEK